MLLEKKMREGKEEARKLKKEIKEGLSVKLNTQVVVQKEHNHAP